MIIVAHHGANNGSSRDFIDEVTPRFVIFPAGHSHGHPRAKTAERYKDTPSVKYMFRTDHGGKAEKKKKKEWKWSKKGTKNDKAGDDHVDISISPTGRLLVYYEKAGQRSYAVNQD